MILFNDYLSGISLSLIIYNFKLKFKKQTTSGFIGDKMLIIVNNISLMCMALMLFLPETFFSIQTSYI